jgi:hypothetical protein
MAYLLENANIANEIEFEAMMKPIKKPKKKK